MLSNLFEAQQLLEAYYDQEKNKKEKQIEDAVYAEQELELKKRLNDRLFIEKKNYGPLKFCVKEIRDRYNLRINESLNWVISDVNEKEKCPRIYFDQPKVDEELLETDKVPLIVYSKFALPLEGLLAACFAYSRMTCSNIIKRLIVQTDCCVCACSERTAKGNNRV